MQRSLLNIQVVCKVIIISIAFLFISFEILPSPIYSQDVGTPTDSPTITETVTDWQTITETPVPTLTDIPLPTEAPTYEEVPTLTDIPLPTEAPTYEEVPSITETPVETASAVGSMVPIETATEPIPATETATAFPTEPPMTLLTNDNFDSGDLSDWILSNHWILVPNDSGQALQINGSDEPAIFAQNNLGDAAAQIRVIMNTGAARLSLRQSDVGVYSVLLDMSGQVSLYRNEQLLGSATVNPIALGQWSTIRLSAVGDMIGISIDGIELITVQDLSPLPPGSISFGGVGLSEGALRVDDFALWIPSGSETTTPTIEPTETATVTATATLPPITGLGLFYSQNFDGTTDPFHQLFLGQWPLVPSEGNQALYLSGEKHWTRVTLQRPDDVAVSARFFLINGVAQLSVRHTDTDNYTVSLQADSQLILYRDDVPVATATLSNIPGFWHTLKLAAIGNTIRVFVDEIETITFIDESPLPAGMILFAGDDLGNSHLLVDDIQVWVPGRFNLSQSSKASNNSSFSSAFANPSLMQSASFSGDEDFFKPNEVFVATSLDFTSPDHLPDMVPSTRPTFSPDGNQIAYNCIQGICITFTDNTSNYSPLVTDIGPGHDPTWSPDGSQIAFTATGQDPISENQTYGIWSVNRDGSALTLLMDHGYHPKWVQSSTGEFIFFEDFGGVFRYSVGTHAEEQVVFDDYATDIDVVVDRFGQIWMAHDTVIQKTIHYGTPHLGDVGAVAVRDLSSNTLTATLSDQTESDDSCVGFAPYHMPVLSPDASQVAYLYDMNGFGQDEACTFAGVGSGLDSVYGNQPEAFVVGIGGPDALYTTWDWGRKTASLPIQITGKIAFVAQASEEDASVDVYVITNWTDDRIRLTNDGLLKRNPVISHDGTRVAYVSLDGPNWHIYVKPVADGTDDTNRVQIADGDYPTWSPDGSKIAYTGIHDSIQGVWIINSDGSGEPQLKIIGDYEYLAWSPVENKLLYSAYNFDPDPQNFDIYLLDLDTPSQPVQLTNSLGDDRMPIWSQDGSQIVFTSNRLHSVDVIQNYNVFIMDADGNNVTAVTSRRMSDNVHPTISPDGTQIAFTSYYPHYDDSPYFDYSDSIISFEIFQKTESTEGGQSFGAASAPNMNRQQSLEATNSIVTWVPKIYDFKATAGHDSNWLIFASLGEPPTPMPTSTPEITDLELSQTVDIASPDEGDFVKIILTVVNNGPSDAANVIVTDLLPDGLNYDSDSSADNTYNPSLGIWTIQALAAEENISLEITAKVIIPVNVDIDENNGKVVNFYQSYLNITTVNLDSHQADSNIDNNDSSLQLTPGICAVSYTGEGDEIKINAVRAPIRGNPALDQLTNKNFIIDAFATDPINTGVTWFHVASSIATDGTVTQIPSIKSFFDDNNPMRFRLLNNWVEINTNSERHPLVIDEETFQHCLGNTTPQTSRLGNTSDVFGEILPPDPTDYPFTFPPSFTGFPVSFNDTCNSTLNTKTLHGLGYRFPTKTSDNPETWTYQNSDYGATRYHFGVDAYVPAFDINNPHSVYSIADHGIIVGIGYNNLQNPDVNEFSAKNWGATNVIQGNGYNIIVRYGSLFVLYGHLYSLDDKAYVGALVNAGTPLGAIGTSDASANIHTHIEIRNYGSDNQVDFEKALEKRENGALNPYGILSYKSPQQAFFMYDFAQFYDQTGGFSDPSNSTQIATGYYKDMELTEVADSGHPPLSYRWLSNIVTLPLCDLQYMTIPQIQDTKGDSGYRGLQLGVKPNDEGDASRAVSPDKNPTLNQEAN